MLNELESIGWMPQVGPEKTYFQDDIYVGEELLNTFPRFLDYLRQTGVGVDPDSYAWARAIKGYLKEENDPKRLVQPVLNLVRETGSKARVKDKDGGRLMLTIKEIGGKVQFGGIVHQGNPQDRVLESKVCNALFRYYSGIFPQDNDEFDYSDMEIPATTVIKPSDPPMGIVGSETEGIHLPPNHQHLRSKGESLSQGKGPTIREQIADKIVK